MIDFTNEDIKEGIGATFYKECPMSLGYIKQPLTPQRSSAPKLRRQLRKPETETVLLKAACSETPGGTGLAVKIRFCLFSSLELKDK